MHGQSRTGGHLSASRFIQPHHHVRVPLFVHVRCTCTRHGRRENERDHRPAVGAVHLSPGPASRDPRHLSPAQVTCCRRACTWGQPAGDRRSRPPGSTRVDRSIVSHKKMHKARSVKNAGITARDRSIQARRRAQQHKVAD